MSDSSGAFGRNQHHLKNIFDVFQTIFDRNSGHVPLSPFGPRRAFDNAGRPVYFKLW
jgi:hypothetical protein